MYMEKIASFTVDHNKLDRGIYTSRVDGDCYTFDLRMKKPNTGDVLATDAMHAIEHIAPPGCAAAASRTRSSTSGPWAAVPDSISSPGTSPVSRWWIW